MTAGRLGAGETFGARGYEVTYRVGKTAYRTQLPQVVAVCAAHKERCDTGGILQRLLDEGRGGARWLIGTRGERA